MGVIVEGRIYLSLVEREAGIMGIVGDFGPATKSALTNI
jgi:hypothetical protein